MTQTAILVVDCSNGPGSVIAVRSAIPGLGKNVDPVPSDLSLDEVMCCTFIYFKHYLL